MAADLVAWLRVCIDEDERAAQTMAEFFPPPWDMSDRGWIARVVADEPDFRTVTRIEQWTGQPQGSDAPWLGDMIEHVARWDPARVLAEVASKRAILDQYRVALQKKDWPACTALEAVLPLLAAPFASRPGFDPSWTS